MLFKSILMIIVIITNRMMIYRYRRLLSNATYFLFFYTIILGLFSALFRLLESLFLGILFISRLDKSLLIRGYESWDSGKYTVDTTFLV